MGELSGVRVLGDESERDIEGSVDRRGVKEKEEEGGC